MISYQCIISGKVQGVYYRSHIQEMASEAGFNGYVMNLTNGKVEAIVTLNDEITKQIHDRWPRIIGQV